MFNFPIINPKQLFLLDGSGALISALFLGVVLVQLEVYVGMPIDTLYVLAALALIFAMYSLCCFAFFPANWKPFLKGIAITNTVYCCLTLSLVIIYFQRITTWGLTYFIAEILIICFIALLEFKTVVDK